MKFFLPYLAVFVLLQAEGALSSDDSVKTLISRIEKQGFYTCGQREIALEDSEVGAVYFYSFQEAILVDLNSNAEREVLSVEIPSLDFGTPEKIKTREKKQTRDFVSRKEIFSCSPSAAPIYHFEMSDGPILLRGSRGE